MGGAFIARLRLLCGREHPGVFHDLGIFLSVQASLSRQVQQDGSHSAHYQRKPSTGRDGEQEQQPETRQHTHLEQPTQPLTDGKWTGRLSHSHTFPQRAETNSELN